MLLALHIKNIALIDEMIIHFPSGFNVFTGETGAGKSIIIDALNLILGSRSDKALIRSSCNSASVEATISIKNLSEAKDFLDKESITYDNDIISVYRRISDNGRNACRVNGEPVTLQMLKELMKNIIDIVSQHSSTLLLDCKNQLDILDNFGDENHRNLINLVNEKYELWYKSSIELKKLLKLNKEKEILFDKTQKDLAELDNAKIYDGEELELENKRDEIYNSVKIRDSLKIAYYNLYGFANDSSVLSKLKEAVDAFNNIRDINDKYDLIYKNLSNSYFDLENDFIEIRSLKENHNFNDEIEQQINERLDIIKKIKRKFGPGFEDVQQKHMYLQNKMDTYTTLPEAITNAENCFKKSLSSYRDSALMLSSSRISLSKSFENYITDQLNSLGMPDAKFHINFVSDSKMRPSRNGNDNVVFEFSSNKGEPLKSLAESASGGELSRITLAIKTIQANKNDIPCLIFDEIDTGISGNAAQVVATKIAYISKYRQVFAVSHLAQIASMADSHFYVNKNEENGRTITKVIRLCDDERYKEIARLLGLIKDHEDTAIDHAKIMIDAAKKYKAII